MNARFYAILSLSLILCACGDDANSNDDTTLIGGGGGGGAQLDCPTVCEAKAQECGAPPGAADCTAMCSLLSSDQVVCLRDADCATVFTANTGEELCGTTGGGTANNGGGTANNGGGTGNNSGGGVPTAVTVSGSFEQRDPIAVQDGDQMVYSVSIHVDHPTLSEQLPDSIESLNDASIAKRVLSPDPGACQFNLQPLLSSNQVSVGVTGADTLPATACADFISAVGNQGIELVAEDVPYLNIGGTVDITIELTP